MINPHNIWPHCLQKGYSKTQPSKHEDHKNSNMNDHHHIFMAALFAKGLLCSITQQTLQPVKLTYDW